MQLAQRRAPLEGETNVPAELAVCYSMGQLLTGRGPFLSSFKTLFFFPGRAAFLSGERESEFDLDGEGIPMIDITGQWDSPPMSQIKLEKRRCQRLTLGPFQKATDTSS